MTDLDPTIFGHFKDSLNAVIDQSKDVVPEEHPAKVIGRDDEGTLWVRIYGAEKDTPVTMAVVDALEGDLVGVKIVDGNSIMTWNTTSPAATVNQLGRVTNRVVSIEGDIRATNGKFVNLEAENARITNLVAENAEITNAKIQNLEAEDAYIENLVAEKADITDLQATNANIANLNAIKANVVDLTATNANITALVSKLAGFDTAVADFIAAQHLEVNLADIDVAAISEGWIKDLMVQGEIIAQSGQIFYLDSVHINAEKIDAGTLNVDRLIVTGQDGKKYLVQVNNQGTPTYVEVADQINDRTLTATKLIANSITTNEITVNNLVGTGGWINLANGTFKYMNVHSHEDDDDNWDDSSNGISWDGSSLQIKADNVELSSGESISSIVTDLEGKASNDDLSLLRSSVNQNAEGINVTIENITTLTNDLTNTNSDLSTIRQYVGEPGDPNGLLSQLNERVFSTIPVYMDFKSSNGHPLLTIGGGDDWGQFKLEISNTGLHIINESTGSTPAYFTKDRLLINEAEVVGDLYFGTGDNAGWQWTVRTNGHMTLRKNR